MFHTDYVPASDAVVCPVVVDVPVVIDRGDFHRILVEREIFFRSPFDVDVPVPFLVVVDGVLLAPFPGRVCLTDGHVGEMAFAGGGKGTVEDDPQMIRIGVVLKV